MKRKWRFVRCIWRDMVDLFMWLVFIGFFLAHVLTDIDVSKILFVVIGYVYYAMFRRETFWQRWQKLRRHMIMQDKRNPDTIIWGDDI